MVVRESDNSPSAADGSWDGTIPFSGVQFPEIIVPEPENSHLLTLPSFCRPEGQE
jgi:hypothetical protein